LVGRLATVTVERTPGLIWVHGRSAGDVMVDRSIRAERLRPLTLSRVAACGREPCEAREPAGRVQTIAERAGASSITVASLSR
jgi:hypothetical protein